jgi:endoglucanase
MLAGAVVVSLGLAPAALAGSPPDAIRVGGPSAGADSKVAIVGSDRRLAGSRFEVADAGGRVVLRGRLRRARGRPAPWKHAYRANLSAVSEPGAYRVSAAGLRSRPWQVIPGAAQEQINAILGYFDANRDGAEPSRTHGPVHLNDAVIHPDAPAHGGERIAISGGWMDAGDMLHFTQNTAFSTALLEAAARLDPAAAPALRAEADVGVRWLLAAHPFPDAFVAQVGDERDHELGFRDPAADDPSGIPGIGTRFAYTLGPQQIGGDLGGKAAAALAMAYQRSGDPALLGAAREWYEAGALSAAPAPKLSTVGYPPVSGDFYRASQWQDSMATGALQLFRATGEQRYLDDFGVHIASDDSRPDATIGVIDSFAQLGAADACGALGLPPIQAGPALDRSCELLLEDGRIAVGQARSNAFGMPGFFSWGTTAQNGGSGALAALASVVPGAKPGGCEVAAGARDYLLGRNPFGAGFVVGYGAKAARHPHHWASVFGKALPAGAVVGGPAPRSQVREQGFRTSSRFDSAFASYEDARGNYVTSEPALDYAATSILLLAALEAHC